MVVFVVRHDHFALEPVIHLSVFPVLRVLLCHNLSGTEKIFPGHGHPGEQGFHTGKDICEILKKLFIVLKIANPLIL